MNNFQTTPTAAVLTITNPVTGKVFTEEQIFRGLFAMNNYSAPLFRKADAIDDYDLTLSIDFVVFSKKERYANNGEMTNEQRLEYKTQQRRMMRRMTEDRESLMQNLIANARGLLTKKDADGCKNLNIEFAEELLNFKFGPELTEYANKFKLVGEAGDWYFVSAEDKSCCFGGTQTESVLYLLYNVLNVAERATALATRSFGDGNSTDFTVEYINRELSLTDAISRYALDNADLTVLRAVAYKNYGHWNIAYVNEVNSEKLDDSSMYFDSYNAARMFSRDANVVLRAKRALKDNEDNIRNVKNDLAKYEALTFGLQEALKEAISNGNQE